LGQRKKFSLRIVNNASRRKGLYSPNGLFDQQNSVLSEGFVYKIGETRLQSAQVFDLHRLVRTGHEFEGQSRELIIYRQSRMTN
jgi:hypothetical protein